MTWFIYGLEPGRYDLRDYLRRKDGSPAKDLPAIPVAIEPVLPPGPGRAASAGPGSFAVPGRLSAHRPDRGNRLERRPARDRCSSVADGVPRPRRSRAGRRRWPIASGRWSTPRWPAQLSSGQQAELERLLIGYWRRRLNLEQAAPARFMAVLRDHEEAGPLLRQLEDWLHRPAGTAGPVDVAALLRALSIHPRR